jgi:putative transposase
VFDLAIISYHLGLTCEAKHLVQITQEALMKRQLFDKLKEEKPVIRSDNGPQFISHLFEEACDTFEMIHDRHGSIYDLSPYEYIDALQKQLIKPKEIRV